MAKKGHLFLGSTESQKNRLIWEQYFPGYTMFTDLGHTTEIEVAPALNNYFNWFCLEVLIRLCSMYQRTPPAVDNGNILII